MDVRELPSDSDESDADYVPSGAESNPPSEVESEGEVEGSGEEVTENEGKRKCAQANTKRKQRKKVRRIKKKSIEEDEEEKAENEVQNQLTEEEEKKKADSLWSDFMKDTTTLSGSKSKPILSSRYSSKKDDEVSWKPEPLKKQEKENKVTITKVFEFAGEQVRVTKEVAADSAEVRMSSPAPQSSVPGVPEERGCTLGGLQRLSSVLGQLGKKAKIGTLEKSKLDWDHFKKAQGLESEIQTYNRGKDGYLEKQDFLQRADLRQFEIEKELRTTRRSNR